VNGGVRPFRAEDEMAVRAIQYASLATDGIPGFGAYDIERSMLRTVADPEGTIVAVEAGTVVGNITPHHDDLTVLPGARRRGHGRRLVVAALDLMRRRGLDELQLYVPPHLPASIAFAHAVGLTYRSSLWQFVLAADHPVPPAAFPPGVEVRPFDALGPPDLEAWTVFMHAAFEGHPTQLTWTPEVIRHVHADTSFDPALVLVVTSSVDPAAPIAFTRLDLHEADAPSGRPVGGIGLLGVLPAWRGHGLGRALLRRGIETLRLRGAGGIELAVEATNDRATTLYRAHGFVPTIEWPHWVLPAAGERAAP
jgi:mycothiol synthase